ncbi:hypothetical protein G6F43_009161 [Rhizopus delemar]|nr:hypothetical protein G6F43_009161 [Rhizopus delemar]
MDPESTVSSIIPPHHDPIKSIDICYSYQSPDQQHPVLNIDALNTLLNDNYLKQQQQLESKLVDLLRDEETFCGKDIIKDPFKLSQRMIDRYTFYSPEFGSFKSQTFRHLLVATPYNTTTISELLVNTTNWWIDIYAPTNEEMRSISKVFCIHPLTTEDIQAQEPREKCEIFQNYMFISFRTFDQNIDSPNYLDAVNFYIVVFKDGILTFRFHELNHSHNVRRRIHQLKDFIKVTPEWINYALIDDITDGFAPLIEHTELEVDSVEDLVLVLNGSEQNDMLRRIGSCRKTVMKLLRLLGPKADVLRSLIKRYEDRAKEMEYVMSLENTTKETELDEVKAHHEVTLYLGDIQDHIITMLQNVNHYDLILGRAHRNYLGQITIELSQAGNNTNEVINRLTFFATIIIPLNLISGLFGMNVAVPGQNEKDLAWFFWIVLGMLVYVVASIAVGKRTGFL